MADINHTVSTPSDVPVPLTTDPELEYRLSIIAGQVDGLENVLRMIYEGGGQEREFASALLLVMNVAGEAAEDLRKMARDFEAHRHSAVSHNQPKACLSIQSNSAAIC